jgi:hypothetical protein
MLIKSGVYLQKASRILIAFYAKFNVKHCPNSNQVDTKYKALEKKINTLVQLILQFMSY